MFLRRKLTNQTSDKTFQCDQVISTLQKAIRRGNLNLALSAAQVLVNNGFIKAAFKRLIITCSEDVCGPFLLPNVIQPLHDQILSQKGVIELNPKPLYDAICILCQQPKSRMNATLTLVANKDLVEQKQIVITKRQTSDVVKDGFLQSIARKDVRASMMFANASQDKNWIWVYLLKLVTTPEEKKCITILQKWHKLTSSSLHIAHAIRLCCKHDNHNVELRYQLLTTQQQQIASLRDIPDFALDKHTDYGKRVLKRGILHFFTEGALVEPLAYPDPFEKEAMEWYLEIERKEGTRHAKSTWIQKKIDESGWVPGSYA